MWKERNSVCRENDKSRPEAENITSSFLNAGEIDVAVGDAVTAQEENEASVWSNLAPWNDTTCPQQRAPTMAS